ncbi:MAG: nucleoside hydrolase [Planctomycetes bacterium]|nr:nucleoside hydrolase [Planctomycetota bacterium]
MNRPLLPVRSLLPGLLGVVLVLTSGLVFGAAGRTPVIFDTDICDDIDDTWALALLLQAPELDCKLVTTAVHDTEAKARVVAKYLDRADRTEIPIGIGVKQPGSSGRQTGWAGDYALSSYPGRVLTDGVQAIIDTIMNSPTRVTLIAVGPLPNVAAALRREPRIARKADFIGMHGSVYLGYNGKAPPSAEYNVKADVEAAKTVFTAPWPITITPLDTCGLVVLRGDKYQKILQRNSPITRNLLENYRVWFRDGLRGRQDLDDTGRDRLTDEKLKTSSTVLFDTVAIYLAIRKDLVEMKPLPIRITDDGFTRVEEGAKTVDCAVQWSDLDGYERWLVERLTR